MTLLIDGLRRSPMVMIMEKEHAESKIELAKLFKKIIVNASWITIVTIAVSIIFKCYAIGTFHTLFTAISSFFICRHLMKSIDLTRVGMIEFNTVNKGMNINDEDVYNTTRDICQIRGKLHTISKSIDFFTIYSSILLIVLIADSAIKHIIK